jgi:hypothetical protein
MADVNVRRSQHVASKAAEEEEEQVKRVTAALECEIHSFPFVVLTEVTAGI